MKYVKLFLYIFLLCITCNNATLGQVAEPLPDKKIGVAEIYYFKEKNTTRAQIRIYLQGRAEEIGSKKDTISMDVIFEVAGQKVERPKYATLAFSVYSAEQSKYSKNHDIQIYTDGMEGTNRTSWRTRLLTNKLLPTGGTMEIFLSSPLEYERIVRITNAAVAIITIGDSRFTLKNQDLQAFKDLNQTIEK